MEQVAKADKGAAVRKNDEHDFCDSLRSTRRAYGFVFALEVNTKKQCRTGWRKKLPKNDDEHRVSWPCARGLEERTLSKVIQIYNYETKTKGFRNKSGQQSNPIKRFRKSQIIFHKQKDMGDFIYWFIIVILFLAYPAGLVIHYLIKRWRADNGVKYRPNDKFFYFSIVLILIIWILFKLDSGNIIFMLLKYSGTTLIYAIFGMIFYYIIKFIFKDSNGQIVRPRIYLPRLIYFIIVIFSFVFKDWYSLEIVTDNNYDNLFLEIGSFLLLLTMLFALKLLILGVISFLFAYLIKKGFAKELPLEETLLFHLCMLLFSLIAITLTAIIGTNVFLFIMDAIS
jgi:hypothetical protein